MFASLETRMFRFLRPPAWGSFDAIFARVWVRDGTPPPETGLWCCRALDPSGTFSDWSQPVQIMTAEDRGWHSGPSTWRQRMCQVDFRGLCDSA